MVNLLFLTNDTVSMFNTIGINPMCFLCEYGANVDVAGLYAADQYHAIEPIKEPRRNGSSDRSDESAQP